MHQSRVTRDRQHLGRLAGKSYRFNVNLKSGSGFENGLLRG
jgi:hypothetical protein